MKIFFLNIAMLMLPLPGLAFAADLSITVRNVVVREGTIRASVCDKNTFLQACAYTAAAPASADEVVLSFKGLPSAHMAISVYHDANDNHKLDRNFFGWPTEAHGFSRNAKGRRGPPEFEDAAIDIKDGKQEIQVTLAR